MSQIFGPRIRRLIAQRLGVGQELNLLDRRTRQLAFTYGFSLIGGTTLLVYGLTYLLAGDPGHAIVDFSFALFTGLNIVMLRRRGHLVLATSMIIGLMMALATYLLMSGGLVGTGFLWLFTIPILAFFLQGWIRGAWWSGGLVVGVLLVRIGQSSAIISTPYSLTELAQIAVGLITISVMIALFEVVTEKYEAALVNEGHNLRKFQQAVDASSDSVLMTDPAGHIIYVNSAWERITGYGRDEVIGKNPRILKSGKMDPAVYSKMWQTVIAGRTFKTDEIINRRKDGSEYIAESHIFPIQHHHKNIYFVELQQDITARKTLDRAKSEFVSLAAHQLTTPLSAISWFSELMLDGAAGPLNDQQKHLVGRIEQSNKHMISLVNALLNSSRIDLGTFIIAPQSTDLGKIVREEVEESRAGFPDGPQASASVDKAVPNVNVDPNLFTMIVQNLVTNALRYTPVDGRVTVDLRVDGQDAILTVVDNGIGIPEPDQPKIFTKLFRSSNASAKIPNGNGLGLYIVKAVIDQSGGTIGFTSKPGMGSTFTVRIPLTGMKERPGARELTRDL